MNNQQLEHKYQQLILEHKKNLREYNFEECQKLLKQAVSLKPSAEVYQLVEDLENIRLDESLFFSKLKEFLSCPVFNLGDVKRLQKLHHSCKTKGLDLGNITTSLFDKLNLVVKEFDEPKIEEILLLLKFFNALLKENNCFTQILKQEFSLELFNLDNVEILNNLVQFLTLILCSDVEKNGNLDRYHYKFLKKEAAVIDQIMFYLNRIIERDDLTIETLIINFYNRIKQAERTLLNTIENDKFEKLFRDLAKKNSKSIKALYIDSKSHKEAKDSLNKLIKKILDTLNKEDQSYFKGLSFLKTLIDFDPSIVEIFISQNSIKDIIEYVESVIELSKDKNYITEIKSLVIDVFLAVLKSRQTDTSQINGNIEFIKRQLQSLDHNISLKAGLVLLKIYSQKDFGKEKNITDSFSKLSLDFIEYEHDIDVSLVYTESFLYFSNQGYFKDKICNNEKLFIKLLNMNNKVNAAQPPNQSILLLNIIYNLVYFLPVLRDEEISVRNLKKKAQGDNQIYDPYEDVYNENSKVRDRIKKIAKNEGVFKLITDFSTSKSSYVWEILSKIYNCLSNENSAHSRILQYGMIKLALNYLNNISLQSQFQENEVFILLNILQFFSRMGIHNNPETCFPRQIVYDVALFMMFMIVCPNSKKGLHHIVFSNVEKLHQFEALMCLTNLASSGPEVLNYLFFRASKLTNDNNNPGSGFAMTLFGLMLDQNDMIQRAATQLYCNLSTSTSEHSILNYLLNTPTNGLEQLHLLLALTDIDDVQTQLAAGGSLAILSSYEGVAEMFWKSSDKKEKNLTNLLKSSIKSNYEHSKEDNIFHRLLLILRNLIQHAKGTEKYKDNIRTLMDSELVTIISTLKKSSVFSSMVINIADDILKQCQPL